MSQAHDAARAALRSACVSHYFYFRSLPQLLKDSTNSWVPKQREQVKSFARSLVPFPAFSTLALLLHKDGSFFSDSPQCEVLGLTNHWKGFYFLWVVKGSGVNAICFPHFLANSRDCTDWYEQGVGGVCVTWNMCISGYHMLNYKHGGSIRNILFSFHF